MDPVSILHFNVHDPFQEPKAPKYWGAVTTMIPVLSVERFVQWQQETRDACLFSRLVPLRYVGASPDRSITLAPNGLWGTGENLRVSFTRFLSAFIPLLA